MLFVVVSRPMVLHAEYGRGLLAAPHNICHQLARFASRFMFLECVLDSPDCSPLLGQTECCVETIAQHHECPPSRERLRQHGSPKQLEDRND